MSLKSKRFTWTFRFKSMINFSAGILLQIHNDVINKLHKKNTIVNKKNW